ncbi:chaperone Ric-8A isoform X2 [Dermacentor andersoni]|uniref:chaperone Ric-8A isoform X2 n=1 Tax=Dermacentor andersoni TaxID=34620 RepID=UPI003B3B8352
MGPPIVDQLLAASHDQVESLLKEFNAKHAQIFTFPDLSLDDRQRLVSWMIEVVSSGKAKESCQVRCLETLRLLSRDRCHLEEVFSADVLASLARVAQLTGRPSEELGQVEHLRAPVVVEALKTLCNLIYNSAMVQQTCSHNGCVEGVMLRLKLYVHPDLPHNVKFFDMRMLFLLTALCADTRPRLRTELHGLIYLRETLDLVLKLSEERTAAAAQSSPGPKRCMRLSRRGRHGGDPVGGPTVVTPVLSTEEALLAAEVLKVLYNLTCSLDKFHVEEEDEVHFERLVGLLHDLLLCDVADVETKDQLHGWPAKLGRQHWSPHRNKHRRARLLGVSHRSAPPRCGAFVYWRVPRALPCSRTRVDCDTADEDGTLVTLATSTHRSSHAAASGETPPPIAAAMPLYGRLEPFEGDRSAWKTYDKPTCSSGQTTHPRPNSGTFSWPAAGPASSASCSTFSSQPRRTLRRWVSCSPYCARILTQHHPH